MTAPVVGIDLGTSNSVVSVVLDGEAVVIPDAEGRRIQPSVLAFLQDGQIIVGRDAKSRMAIDPRNTVYSVKRLTGRTFGANEITVSREKAAYEIVRGEDDNPRIVVRGRPYAIEEIQALILRHMRRIAEDYLGEPVTRAVITVPANFNEAQRLSTKTAGEIAGLDVLRILNEPTAAALAYGFEKQRRERIAVYDFGGGTFDVTILELRDNVFEVLSTAGNTFLGGDDFDFRVAGLIADAFRKQFGHDLSRDNVAMQRLKAVGEKLKSDLTEGPVASVDVKEAIAGSPHPAVLRYRIDRPEFDRACAEIVQRSFLVCDEALRLARVTSAEVDKLVMVGGTTRVPLVRSMVERYFFKQPLTDINPDEVVAVGAAIFAHGIDPHARQDDIEELDDDALIPAAAPALLIDVIPHSLGIETLGGFTDVIVHRNAAIPARYTRTFATSTENQDTVRLQILEGESRAAAENRRLGELLLQGLRPGPRGEVSIDVTFEINSDGMLVVTARDRMTGVVQRTRLNVAGGLSEEERSRLMAQGQA